MNSLPKPDDPTLPEAPLATSAGVARAEPERADPIAAWLDLMETVELLRPAAGAPPPRRKQGGDYRL